jgi:hypothetical protein
MLSQMNCGLSVLTVEGNGRHVENLWVGPLQCEGVLIAQEIDIWLPFRKHLFLRESP